MNKCNYKTLSSNLLIAIYAILFAVFSKIKYFTKFEVAWALQLRFQQYASNTVTAKCIECSTVSLRASK